MRTTYLPSDLNAGEVRRALARAGFAAAPPLVIRTVLLDTFDGRLHASGLRLALETASGQRRLVLTGAGLAPAHAAATDPPAMASDLPPGPLRARLAPVLDVRALRTMLTIDARATVASRCDRAGKVLTTATILEDLRANGTRLEGASWLLEIDELLGYAKAAASARAEIEGLGLMRSEQDLVELAASAAEIDLRGCSLSPTVPLQADEPALDAYRAVLDNLAAAIAMNWQGTIDDIDSEFLHDLRVAVRRTRSVVAQAKGVLPPAARRQRRADFKRFGDLTSPARDLDVYVLEWDGYVGPLGEAARPALQPVLAALEQRRRAEHARLARQLRSARTRGLLGGWREWLAAPIEVCAGMEDAERPIGEVAAARIKAAQRQLIDRGRRITEATPAEELHELRKDAKKLRYLLECFGGLYDPAARKAFVGHLKKVQDNLGEHQDAEVHVAQLRELATDLHADGQAAPGTLLAMGQLTEHLDQRRRAARDEFAVRFKAYDTAPTRGALQALLASSGPAPKKRRGNRR